ncbi:MULTISPECIES: P-loop NTPase family protein [Siphonobacter]|uniref:Magnesium chelatase n=1 Tax=Siphonobacter curvatus TaxID=2094562 RepID=A0A2S7IM53_9BACT|nr:sigma 54-interacting transcriptional regulator [Siphonobacter curvatus]PQA58729.1 magnesium chelatase [Siphonobacter curvatus]
MSYHSLSVSDKLNITTLGQLKAAGYQPESIKDELRRNLITKMRSGEEVFPGVYGYEDTVIPDVERALLSRHHINLLGLRGQAKTRIARLMIYLLDEYIPVVEGSELNDDPLQPLSRYAVDLIAEKGDETPVIWLHRDERYTEKLATPDVSVADLIGDADPIKAATLKLPYSDERVIHFGLIPRSHRGIFVINELPDLQARIQVSLFNILQEGDIQIRGFKLRLPLDIQFVFTANPEDYTNRGSIVTPLKDRIDSQILTHYPRTLEIGKRITRQEAKVKEGQEIVSINEVTEDLIEQIAIEARQSEYVDAKSGVSARMTISAYENLVSAAERRALLNSEERTYVRLADLYGVIPAITGKVELVYEGEVEGPYIVAMNLVSKAIKTQFLQYFPDPEKLKKQIKNKKNPFQKVQTWFGEHSLDLLSDLSDKDYQNRLLAIDGLDDLVEEFHPELTGDEKFFFMEFALHGMAEFSLISKKPLDKGLQFKDLTDSLIAGMNFDDDDEEEDDDEEDFGGRRRR